MDSTFAARLAQTKMFRSRALPPEVIALWAPVSLAAGQVLWKQHAPATARVFLLSGELAVRIGSEEVGRIRAGELVGESSAFVEGEVRTGTVVALGPAARVAVDCPQLSTLRASYPDVYDALLEQALTESAARIAETDARISSLTRGDRKVPSPAPDLAIPL